MGTRHEGPDTPGALPAHTALTHLGPIDEILHVEPAKATPACKLREVGGGRGAGTVAKWPGKIVAASARLPTGREGRISHRG